MPHFSEERTQKYTARQLYDLVLDVEKYPEFVPMCSDCKIIESSEQKIIADLEVSFAIFSKTYRSEIIHGVKNEEYFIDIKQIEGPFEKLDTKWRFTKLDRYSTKLSFFIEFQFNSLLFKNLIGPIFEETAKDTITAFEKRAEEIYGSNK